SSLPGAMTTLQNKTMFAASTEANGRELWISDGTEASTSLVT
ncbi:MAG: hypothetical protein HC859_16660, partial [Bacteroidia bacterium]|nr:hypothetical protein [Bacteroidia bacterium]